ncbi:MAG: 4-alpha-glucanotransferase [Chitinivibrionales bacterium]|nr:4-alpha-glucanotransferase [Chitinivibrionales bacterium]MBD3357492.1 4-alpha-glucanotransferase [Chitinivibrionales bacterium]
MERSSGILLHVTSLPSPYGIGDLGPGAYQFIDSLAEAGQSYWQLLPLGPSSVEVGNTPYFSTSAMAGNPLLVSPERLLKWNLINQGDLDSLRVPESGSVDFERVEAARWPVLEKAYRSFMEGEGDHRAFETFCAEQSEWLDDYALYNLLRERFGRNWSQWPVEYRERNAGALEELANKEHEACCKSKFFQYLFFSSWFDLKKYCHGKGIYVIGDLPIYVGYDCADVWSRPDVFKLDDNRRPFAVSGVPPDYFSATGQLWNTPVYDWARLKECRYDWWVRRMEAVFARFDMVRIDHFRGLVQYWEVPAGEKTAMNGEWMDVPVYDFFDTMLERFPGFPVIAEDLGTITPDVRDVMKHYGFPGMKVLLFAFGDDDPRHIYLPHMYEQNTIVYTGTHDNNTVRGWFETEASEDARARLMRYLGKEVPVEDVGWEMIRLSMMSVSELAVLPVQDLLGLGDEARMNDPSKHMGNWKWRLMPEQLHEKVWGRLRDLTVIYGRERR